MAKTLSLGRDWDAIVALGHDVIDREKARRRQPQRDAATGGPFRTRDAAVRDNPPPTELRREQEAALAGNAAPGGEIWDATGEEFEGEAASDTFDASQYGVERTADGKFRVRRKRRDRRAADAGPVLDWGSSTQQQIGGLRQLNAFYRRHWETKR